MRREEERAGGWTEKVLMCSYTTVCLATAFVDMETHCYFIYKIQKLYIKESSATELDNAQPPGISIYWTEDVEVL